MTCRVQIIAGNWKLNKGPGETGELIGAIRKGIGDGAARCEVIVAPPFTSLPSAIEAASGSVIQVSAQNLFWEDAGAYTGEISGGMIKQLGCSHVIVGHSERRQYFHETDQTVNRRVLAALRHQLKPICCVGETIKEREAGRTFEVVEEQLLGGLKDVSSKDAEHLILAYEPVWAIGTGHTATTEQAEEVHKFLRARVVEVYSQEVADRMRILYGGSMKPSNAGELLACENIDGGLIGGASLKAEDFLGIINKSSQA